MKSVVSKKRIDIGREKIRHGSKILRTFKQYTDNKKPN